MVEACVFDILALPEADLRKILPKASTRSLAKLLAAYPRAVGHTFLDVLRQCTSAVAIEFIREEMNSNPTPSYREIRQAELEIMKIMHDENIITDPSVEPAIPLAR